MRVKIYLFFAAIMAAQLAPGQVYEHYFRTLSVNGTMDILLEWKIPEGINSSNFIHYNILHSDERTGPFEIIFEGTVLANTSYLHQTDNGTDAPHYYFISTHPIAGDSIISDTLTHIRVKVRAIASSSIAQLTWNPITEMPLYPFKYQIYRKIGALPEIPIALEQETQYYDTSFHNCEFEMITYYLKLVDPETQGVSISTSATEELKDITQPRIPNVKSVTVINNNQVQISWDPSPDSDVAEYQVYENRPPNLEWFFLFPVIGTDTLFSGDNICDGEVNYAVSAVDSCGNIDPPDYEFAHRVIDLQVIEPEICDQTIFFDWSDYINMNPPLQGYRIIEIDLNSGTETIKATTPDSEYTLAESFQNGVTYCYFIEAFNDVGYTSTSCTQCITGYKPVSPDTLAVTNVSVESPQEIRIEWYVDTAANRSTLYRLYRETLSSGTQILVRESSPAEGPQLIIHDANVTTQAETYRYFSEAIDTCGNLMPYHPEATTILLKGERGLPGVYALKWSEATNSSSHFQEYLVVRMLESSIDTVYKGTAQSFTDEVNDPYAAAGEAVFFVIARYEDPFSITKRLSYSNRITLSPEMKMLNFPNAFTPNQDGLNDTFGPENLLNDYNVQEYQLKIYDRWGKRCYQSTNYTERWDGKIEGNPAPAGLYNFKAVLKTPQGSEIIRQGAIVLIK